MSKLILFDFECPKGHIFEELVTQDTGGCECPRCGELARRMITGTHIDPKLGVSNDFPSMARKWAKKQRKRAKQDNSDYHTNPNLWMY